ncbi:MAG TPA: undecaprenyldiphospho-muramoylpentapeptide beta-N-acetylglucosaminyltransferase [Spirochaetia bacterium]|jgi:UDP-N-acetylglucosamine--N-acetylmuramyl-(pentapeptide) pyrophosphoryl-undecaprenol N-acetylglucosamine transferase|nr:undecaprenyldiphospho-muramoylpentapeptide beta-N-acetylglucosaminyltransferase [Spirochaetia bacterium]
MIDSHVKDSAAFTGGGTGGHVFPGIAVYESLRSLTHDTVDCFWIGSRGGIEEELLKRFSIQYEGIHAGKLRRYFSFKNFTDVIKILMGYIEARRILKRRRPRVLFSKGGFVSVPPVIAAHRLGIPVVTHESDVDPGLATRINSRYADVICVAYEKTAAAFPEEQREKVVVTGNPVRDEIWRGNRTKGRALLGVPDGKKVLLVLGGSLGARAINDLIAAIVDDLLPHCFIVHQMGSLSFVPSHREGYVTKALFEGDFPDILMASDLVVSRSGAGTLWENAVCRKPAILIPLGMGSSRGDQVKNAEIFRSMGAARVLDEEGLTPLRLKEEILSLIRDEESLLRMRNALAGFATKNASSDIASILFSYIKKEEV